MNIHTMLRAALLTGLMISFAFAEPDTGENWPHWRGPQYDGVVRETDWTWQWGTGGPKIAWRANIGVGFASMAVVDDRVYAVGHDGEDERVTCLNVNTGEVIWKQQYPGDKIARLHEGGPGATPAVANGKVYTVGKQGQLHCYNAVDGTLVWSSDLRELTGRKDPPQWGYDGSAVVIGDKVFYQAGQTIALHAQTGKQVWVSKKYDPSYATPQPTTWAGKPALAVLNSFGVVLLDIVDGKELSNFPWKSHYNTSSTSPIIDGDRLFVSTGYKRGCGLLQIQDGQMKPIYENKAMSNHINTSVLWSGQIYGFDGQANPGRSAELVCMNFDDGNVRWAQRGLGCGSLLVSNGKLIILTDHGSLVIADATPDAYQELARSEILTGKCWTVPAMAHGRLYARNAAGDLVCVDLRK